MASALLLVAVARWVDVASGLDPAGCSARRRAMVPLAPRMTGSGHEDQFPSPRPSDRCRFSQETFGRPSGNG